MKWWKTLPPEDVPLDDDGPDFLQDNAAEFDAWCLEEHSKNV